MTHNISARVRVGLDLKVRVALKYLRVQFQLIDAAQVQLVGIQVKCPVLWIQLQMELCATHGHLIIVHIAIRYK